MLLNLIAIIFIYFFKLGTPQIIPVSPCPNIFSYETDEEQWYGIIEAPYHPGLGTKLELDVTIGLDAIVWMRNKGRIQLEEPKYIVVHRMIKNQPIKYRILFPSGITLPNITSIMFNNRDCCIGFSYNSVTEYTLHHSLDYATNETIFVATPEVSFDVHKCGIASTTSMPLMVNGDEVIRKQWPWLVAIFKKTNSKSEALEKQYEFRCAGSLISRIHVLTAAHCMLENGKGVNVASIMLKFGPYSLVNWKEDNTQIIGLRSYKTSRDYDSTKQINDIALLVATKSVLMDDFVKHVCLWSGQDDDQSQVVDMKGTVIGWGLNEEGIILKSGPRSVTVPIVSTETCRGSNQFFFSNTSNKTLCAGSRDGSGPCRGDSGGGLYVRQKNRWVVRGIVSNSLSHPELICDLREYVVYTDVAKFRSWIENNLQLE